MGSRRAARLLLVVGFLAAWIGYNAALVSHVVLDPHTTRAAARALLEAPAVQRSLADEVTREIDRQVPVAAQDPRIAAATKTALRDPRVVNAFANTIEQMHESILSATPRTSFVVDGRPLSAAVRDALARSDPQLAAQVARAGPLNITIKTDKLPKLHNTKSAANALEILGIAAALLFGTASLILVHDRRAFGQVGRRTAYLAITPILVFVLLPRVLAHAPGDGPQIAAALLRVYGDRILPSAAVLIVVGVVIAVSALLTPRRRLDDLAAPGSSAPFTGPPPTPRPGRDADQPTITEKLYL